MEPLGVGKWRTETGRVTYWERESGMGFHGGRKRAWLPERTLLYTGS